jgi:putative inorganic carbon (HCO3(-)) transporter
VPQALAEPIRENAGETSPHTLLFFLMTAWVFFLPVQFQNANLNLAPSDLMLALALALGFGRLRLVAGAWSPFHAGLILVFLLGALFSISETGVVAHYVQIKVIGLIALFAAYLCITSATPTWAAVRSLMRTFVLATTLHALIALIAYAAGLTVPGLNYGTERLSGMLLDPNAFGGLVMVALTLQLVTQEGGGALVKGFLGMAVSATLALGLALSVSRTAWIGFGFALTVTVVYRWRLAVAWAALAVTGIAGTWMLLENEDRSLSLVRRTDTAMQRVDQIQTALPLFSNSPILGAGFGSASQHAPDSGTGGQTIIHNTTVWIMTELGLLGLSVFLASLLWFFVRGIAALKVCRPEYKPVILALMSAHAGMIGVSTGIEALYQRHWWFSMALLASCSVLVRREAARPDRARLEQQFQ